MIPAVTIAALQDSRWRCGVQHTPTPVEWPAGRWSEGELELLLADPRLSVIVGEPEPAPDKPPTLTSAQIARLRELTPEQLDAALAPPAEQTVPDIFHEMCRAVFSRAPEDRVEFIELLRAHPVIGPALATAPEIVRQEQLIVAIAGLEEGNEAHWTKGGLPEVRALQAATGLADVSAAERDAAWEEYRKAKEAGAA